MNQKRHFKLVSTAANAIIPLQIVWFINIIY